MRKWWLTTFAVLSLAALVASCGAAPAAPAPTPAATPTPAKAEPLKVAWVYVGPVGDGGYTFAHDQGRKAVEAKFGDKVKTSFIENVPEGAEVTRVLEDLVAKGNKLIFTTSFGFMDQTLEVAQKHPDVLFEHASGFKKAANMGNYFGWNHQAFYLAGVAAGANLKPGHELIGFVGSIPIPEVLRAINAMTLGAQSVNPNAKVKVVWIGSWFDPPKEKAAAESLLAEGAEVLGEYVDSPAPITAAQDKGKLAIGTDSDTRSVGPKAFLTAPIWDWSNYYINRVQAVLDGKWQPDEYMGTLKDGLVKLAPLANLGDPKAKDLVAAAVKKVSDGFEPLSGPLKDQTGAEKVPAGKVMTAPEMLNMDWFVQGVSGSPKG